MLDEEAEPAAASANSAPQKPPPARTKQECCVGGASSVITPASTRSSTTAVKGMGPEGGEEEEEDDEDEDAGPDAGAGEWRELDAPSTWKRRAASCTSGDEVSCCSVKHSVRGRCSSGQRLREVGIAPACAGGAGVAEGAEDEGLSKDWR